ncbi:MAG: carbamoyltransferase HypF [Betaproteobacteria bacterium]|nr:carbamoyltransferase HypF [Betaproteobacteria bacterium]
MSAATISLPVPFASAPPVLAAGAWFKNAVCGVKAGEARMSSVVGDLNTPQACVGHETETAAMLEWLGQPAVIAHDLHPDFHSSRHAAELAARMGARALPVQHHHAHIAGVCAEHGERGPVIGLALDGVGLGTDNTPWGGELLKVAGAHFERLGHLAPLALPGGDRAAREPWRMAAAVLHDLGRGGEITARYAAEPAAATVLAMLEKNFNCPRTSSAGRLFDAASGLLGLCLKMDMDAEAAIKLEQAATRRIDSGGWPAAMAGGWRIDDGVLDLRPLLARLADEAEAEQGAALFHATLVAAMAEWTARACLESNIGTVALGGGCFFNRLLASGLRRELESRGLRVLAPVRLVPGDAGLALGQAWGALHSLEN